MSEWEDIEITGRDKQASTDESVTVAGESQLGLQVFTLSCPAPLEWRKIFDKNFMLESGRLGRKARATSQDIQLWGGPYIFADVDALHLKSTVAFTNTLYRERLTPFDLSGFDVFGQ